MLRKFRIKTRLLISFFIAAFFTLIVGLTGFASLTSIGNLAVKTMDNVNILNDIYDHHLAIDSGVFGMLYISDVALTHYVVQTTKEHTEGLLTQLNGYLASQDQFSDIFSPGEMQDMVNLYEICMETYVPVLNEIFDFVEQGRGEEALAVYINRLTPIYDTVSYYIYMGFDINLKYSVTEITKNSENASLNAYLMLTVVFLSLIVSVFLALAVTKSIAGPLSGLEASADKLASGKLDVSFEQTQSSDEIAHLSFRLQETLQHLNRGQQLKLEAVEAQHKKEEAEASARSKGEFLARMSHEIRTPMNAITGMAELALREDMPDTTRSHILTIKQAGANLLSIINDILDFSKIESGKLDIVPVDYLFSSLINDVISIIRTRVIDSRIRFVVNVDCNIPNALFGDETRIRQVFLNILSNAVKYTEKGFVSLSVTGEIIQDTVNLTVEVADSGRGIKEEDIKKLFGEFVQFDLTDNRGIEGTGLGLAITRNLVELMGGNISVSSEYGRGSTFIVKLAQKIRQYQKLASVEKPNEKDVILYEQREIYAVSILRTLENLGVNCTIVRSYPDFCDRMKNGTWPFVFVSFGLFESVSEILAKAGSETKAVLLAKFGEVLAKKDLFILTMPAHSISIANTLNGITTESSFSSKREAESRFSAPEARILVVDDISTNLKVAEGLLEPYGAVVDTCLDGLEAIELVQRHDYDIVFMDHMMPGMDGIEATAVIRTWEKEKGRQMQTPIIALTANAVSGMREMFIEKGLNDFLAKPIDVSKLDEILDRWIPKEKKQRVDIREQITVNSSPVIPEAIPGLDVQHGIRMTGGKESRYRDVLSMFYKDAQERMPLLQSVPEADGMDMFITQVHALKSALASIGAEKISKDADALETAGKAGDFTLIEKKLPDFANNLAELVKNIHAALKNNGETEDALSGSLSEAAVNLLHKLAAALDVRKVHDIDLIMGQLDGLSLDAGQGSSIRIKFEEISNNVLMAEFENAAEAVQSLLKGAFHGN